MATKSELRAIWKFLDYLSPNLIRHMHQDFDAFLTLPNWQQDKELCQFAELVSEYLKSNGVTPLKYRKD